MKNIRTVIEQKIKEAGKKLLVEYEKFDRAKVSVKYKGQLVSYADLMSEKIIVSAVRKNFPDHGILSEEMGAEHHADKYIWIIDPIDGTTNFTMKNPLWCISIGVMKLGQTVQQNELICGGVYAPVMDELFIAEKGKGARLNGKKISVSKITDDRSVHGYCYGTKRKDSADIAEKYYSRQVSHGNTIRRFGTAALELAYVASGRMESFVAPGANSWDVAAGVLLVREAGGQVTDRNNMAWNLDSSEIAATNVKWHRQILEILND